MTHFSAETWQRRRIGIGIMTEKETTTNQVRGERGQDRGREIGAIAVEVEIDVEEVEVEIEKGVTEVVAEIETGRTRITTEEVAEGIEIG